MAFFTQFIDFFPRTLHTFTVRDACFSLPILINCVILIHMPQKVKITKILSTHFLSFSLLANTKC